MEIAPLGQRLPLWSFMKTKLKVISSKIRKSVRKLMPRPCRAFSSRARLASLSSLEQRGFNWLQPPHVFPLGRAGVNQGSPGDFPRHGDGTRWL